MGLALRSECGARYLYRFLRRRSLGSELRRVLEELEGEERELIDAVAELMSEIGPAPRKWAFRRWVGSAAVWAFSVLIGVRFALRLSVDAEWTVARWYSEYARFLAEGGDTERAERCAAFVTTKQRHAQILQTWVDHGRRTGPS